MLGWLDIAVAHFDISSAWRQMMTALLPAPNGSIIGRNLATAARCCVTQVQI